MKSKKFWTVLGILLIASILLALKCYAGWEMYEPNSGFIINMVTENPVSGTVSGMIILPAALGGGTIFYFIMRSIL